MIAFDLSAAHVAVVIVILLTGFAAGWMSAMSCIREDGE